MSTISDLLDEEEQRIQENVLYNALTHHMMSALQYFEDLSWLSHHSRYHFQSLKLTDTYMRSLLPHTDSQIIPPTSLLMHYIPVDELIEMRLKECLMGKLCIRSVSRKLTYTALTVYYCVCDLGENVPWIISGKSEVESVEMFMNIDAIT